MNFRILFAIDSEDINRINMILEDIRRKSRILIVKREISLSDNSKISRIADSKNLLRKEILRRGHKYAVWIDNNMSVPFDIFVKIMDIVNRYNSLLLLVPYSWFPKNKLCKTSFWKWIYDHT